MDSSKAYQLSQIASNFYAKSTDNGQTVKVNEFHMEFLNGLNKIPHFEFLQKAAKIDIDGCLLEILSDFVDGLEQYVKIDDSTPSTLNVTSYEAQGSLLCPLLFCIFHKNILRWTPKFRIANIDPINVQGDNKWR